MPDARSDLPRWTLGLASGLLGLLAAGAFAWGSDELCLDDAYIHLAYARSLRLGGGFSYNPHDWELGATSPLWALMLVPLAGGTHTVLAVKALGVVLHALSCGLLPALMRALAPAEPEAGRRELVLLAPVALLALHPLLLQGASSGMEVPLTTCLLEGVVLLALRDRVGAAATLACLSVWARPEALCFVGVLALGLALVGRRRALWIGGAAATAMLGWAGYCLAVAGQPLPNTFYAKAGMRDVAGSLRYLAASVLAQEAWLVGAGGLVLLAWLVREARKEPRRIAIVLAVAWVSTLLAIALGRSLSPGVLFYLQRYFAVLAFVPPSLIGAALCAGSARRALWLAPCFALLLARLPGARATMRLQENDIATLHTDVAHWVSGSLPADSRVLVEGAGALRYCTPRSQIILDFLGLNRAAFVHALRADTTLHACLVLLSMPDVAVIPSELQQPFAKLFTGEVLHVFDDPTYAQSTRHWHRRVYALRITGATPELLQSCASLAERKR